MSKWKSNRKVKQSNSGRAKRSELAEAPSLDRRAIEGLMRQLVPGVTDTRSETDATQQIMYQAFEETNPRKQMAFARKALEISPDCADGYVLLAEHSPTLAEKESRRHTKAISATYGEAFDIAPEDVGAAEQHGWPVASPEAYPCALRVNPGMALRTPLKWDLELLEGCLRAIPVFLGRHVSKAEIPVTLSGDRRCSSSSGWKTKRVKQCPWRCAFQHLAAHHEGRRSRPRGFNSSRSCLPTWPNT